MLKRQLYTVYILTLFIPILAVGSYLLYNNYSMVYEHHENMLASDNIRVKSIVFELTTSITNICDSISESKEVTSLLTGRYDSRQEAEEAMINMTVMEDFFERHTETSSIELLTNHPDLFSYEQIKSVREGDEEAYRQWLDNPGYHWSIVTKTNNVGVNYIELELLHPVNVPGSPYDCILKITVSGNYLKNRIDNNSLDVDLIVNDQPIFYSTWGNDGKLVTFKDYMDKPFFTYSGTESYLDGERLLEVTALQPIKSEDSIYVFSSDASALDRTANIQQWTILILAISLIIPTLVIIRYTKQLSNRVETLRREMHRVTGGDYNIIDTFKGNDELADLFKDLKVMIRSINARDKEIFDARLKEQELINHQKTMEMEILSSKINPHFLYNTLETIRMKAFSTDDLEVARAIKLVGKYMRYNLESTGEPSRLGDELRFISLYIDIQTLRFTNRIQADIQVDEDIQVDDIMILPLLIQPLVENAYNHGHKETLEDGWIIIRVKSDPQGIIVEVEDNGLGMDSKKLASVLRRMNEPEDAKGSIGLQNIHQRIKLYYPGNEGIWIKTEAGKGTAIGFRIPSPQGQD